MLTPLLEPETHSKAVTSSLREREDEDALPSLLRRLFTEDLNPSTTIAEFVPYASIGCEGSREKHRPTPFSLRIPSSFDPSLITLKDSHLLPDASFDEVWSLFSLEDADSPRRCFREMGRILKPGGRLRIALCALSGEHPEDYRIQRQLRREGCSLLRVMEVEQAFSEESLTLQIMLPLPGLAVPGLGNHATLRPSSPGDFRRVIGLFACARKGSCRDASP